MIRHDEGYGDSPEPLQLIGAIYAGGLVQVGRHPFQRGQQHQDHEGTPLPDVDGHQRNHRPGGTGQPGNALKAHIAEDVIDGADVLLEQHAANDKGYDDRADHQRHQEPGAKQFLAARNVVQRQRDRQADDQLCGHYPKHEDDGIAHSAPEGAVAQQLLEIGQTDKFGVEITDAVEVQICKGGVEGPQHGDRQQDEDDGRQLAAGRSHFQ